MTTPFSVYYVPAFYKSYHSLFSSSLWFHGNWEGPNIPLWDYMISIEKLDILYLCTRWTKPFSTPLYPNFLWSPPLRCKHLVCWFVRYTHNCMKKCFIKKCMGRLMYVMKLSWPYSRFLISSAMPAVAEVFVTRQVILQTFFGTEHFFNKAH